MEMSKSASDYDVIYTKNLEGEITYSVFCAHEGFVFRDKTMPENEDGEYQYSTAFGLLETEKEKIDDYECLKYEDGMIVY